MIATVDELLDVVVNGLKRWYYESYK
jgi:hypothetical protein